MRIASAFLGTVSVYAAIVHGQNQIPLVGDDQPRRLNVVFVLTDDQDVHLSSLDYMPLLKKHLLDEGTYFNRHYCTTAVCCPSRVTLWTGKAAHNTNVTNVIPPYGGYPKFVAEGFNDNYFPVWLQQAGYNTYYTGKLFNAHTVDNYNSPHPGGFTGSDFLLDPHTYDYLNSTFQRNGEPPRSYEGKYGTDVLAAKAYGLLDEAVHAANDQPFFLTVAPIAPHANVQMKGNSLEDDHAIVFTEPVPAERHKHLFKDEKVPRTLNFNPDKPSGANWLLQLPKQNESELEYNDHFYRQRLRALQAVDELIEGLVSRLEDYGILDNTYVVFSSDNGFHIGQHRLPPGKSCGYEEDTNIPLIVRGPGVERNYSTDIVTTHTDLAPTFFDLLGIPLREDFDGKPIPVVKDEIEAARQVRREHVGIEYWGFAISEGEYSQVRLEHNTYKAIRISGPGYNLYYSVWCTNERELYDMNADPGQLHNLLSLPTANTSSSSSPPPIPSDRLVAGLPVRKVVARLDALLLVLKSCRGATCRRPWDQLHPGGDVGALADALAPRFDRLYESERALPRVRYEFCANGYIREAEGPMWEDEEGVAAAAGGTPYMRDGLRWEDWT
ncbi:Arylsulphatase [Biscogniauxia marginata]|nr:Arylsulphatase [Biscogniauxia marginata]